MLQRNRPKELRIKSNVIKPKKLSIKKKKMREIKSKQLRLNLSNLYKSFDGKKYQCNGVVPKSMEYDIKRVFQKHGLLLKIETHELDSNKIKIWSRRR
jgi:hypothetical protein